ncbi:hypothetical protein L1049_014996 [Liquidambar formosana]|uniref:KIB1-4 beta-propeller domain-containing protein n=1 Tax=Liquidambar formosana TaxID=63359 RepID=A0AAP0RX91_LIQFO
MHLLNPLSIYEFKSLPATFPKVLDLSKFRVSELGQEYVLQCTIFRPDPWGNTVESQTEKVVICPDMCPSSGSSDGFVLLMILAPNDLVIYASRERKGAIIEDMPSPDDVILFNGKFYAVDSTGRTVMVELSSNATLVADSVFGGSKKCLVESRGELLLVDMYKSLDPNELLDQLDDFKVFKLDEKGQKWVEVKSLGDRVLFLGSHSTSAAVGGFGEKRAGDFQPSVSFSLQREETSVCPTSKKRERKERKESIKEDELGSMTHTYLDGVYG